MVKNTFFTKKIDNFVGIMILPYYSRVVQTLKSAENHDIHECGRVLVIIWNNTNTYRFENIKEVKKVSTVRTPQYKSDHFFPKSSRISDS